jgi:OOP family OmpA-OmpF porin
MAVGTTVVLKGVNFDTAKATLTADSRATLDEVVASLTANPPVKVEIGGHTDSRSSDAYNQKLSEARATSVVGYLVAHGVAADRLTAAGYGESQPIADNATAEGRLQNRRVELKIVANGMPATSAGLREIKYIDLEPDDNTAPNSFRKKP